MGILVLSYPLIWNAFRIVIKKAIDKIEKKELIANVLKNK